jgi:hypothetical protein
MAHAAQTRREPNKQICNVPNAPRFSPYLRGVMVRRRSLLLLRDFFFALATIDYKGVVVAV